MASDSPATTPGASEPPAALPEPFGAAKMTHWLRTGTGIVSTAVSLTVGILTLLFLVRPALQPGNEPVMLSAVISSPAIEAGVLLGDYYDRIGETPASEMQSNLNLNGIVATFDLEIAGYQGDPISLRWTVVNAATLSAVEEDWLVDQPGWPNAVFTAEAELDRINSEIWVTLPNEPGQYILRLNLFDQDGVRLDSTDSPTFED